jgi:hypothetical protein
MDINDLAGQQNQKAEAQAQPVEQKTLVESNTVAGDIWEISLPKTSIHTLPQLLDYCKVDLNEWEVERFVCNKWEVVLAPRSTTTGPVSKKTGAKSWERPDATPIHESLFQVKAFLKRKTQIIAIREEIADLLKQAKMEIGEPRKVTKIRGTKGGMLEINLTDHHFGKLAWQLETLAANYDVKIATAVFHRALNALLARAPYETFEEIWFIVGNDLFHADNTASQTTSGTQVESDVRIRKTYFTVRTLMVRAIEDTLRPRADKVKVIVVPGNHDYNTAWYFGDSLQLYFSKHTDVEVDNMPSPRKYHEYGATLIGYTHGHREKQADLPLLMTVEAREQYGRTQFHEWHTGHTHQTRTTEHHGIRVRVLPALCPPDKWHAEMGFVGNLRSSEAFHWDKVAGLTNIIIYTDSDDLIEKASTTPTVVAK